MADVPSWLELRWPCVFEKDRSGRHTVAYQKGDAAASLTGYFRPDELRQLAAIMDELNNALPAEPKADPGR